MILNQYGTESIFQEAEVAKPQIKSEHVLIKIAATSVNTVDTMIRTIGHDLPLSPALPAILGMDFSGIIEEVGEGVSNYTVGDEVYGCAGGLAGLQGTLSEYIVADVKLIAIKPKNLTMREAAALPLVAITAYEGLIRAGINDKKAEQQKVLVHGGAGGVGHVALQLANHFGAKVYATGGDDKKLTLIEKLGANAINYKTEAVTDYVAKHTDSKGFDIVFDSVGGENMINSFEAAALNGQVASTTSLLEIDLSTVHFKGLSLHVVFMLIPMLHNHKREQHAHILSELTTIIEAGSLKPVIDEKSFSLAEAGQAHNRLSSGLAMGKVVVEI